MKGRETFKLSAVRKSGPPNGTAGAAMWDTMTPEILYNVVLALMLFLVASWVLLWERR